MGAINMARQNPFGGFFAHFFALFLSGVAFAFAPDATAAPKSTSLPGADIFDAPGVVCISIEIPEPGMRVLRGYHWQRNRGGEKPKVRAVVSDGQRTYRNVSVQMKGAAGSFLPIDDRPGLTLNFDKHIKGQTFHGLEKISLNNSVQDPSYIAEKISRELFEKAGVPVPRSDFAVVTLNGRNLGLYVLVEGYNKQFLQRYFKNVKGNLYDGGFCQEVNERLNVNSGDNEEDQSDRETLVEAADEARRENRLSGLGKVLDLNRFITMIATEILLCHWDGYAMNRNNYRLFSDKESGKFIFMPHGLDQMFGVGGMGSPHTAIFPQLNGMIARTVLGTTEGRGRYRMRLGELRTNIFDSEKIIHRVREIEARIQPVIGEVGPNIASRYRRGGNWRNDPVDSHKQAVERLCQNIQIREQNLDQQLQGPSGELKFASDGSALIEGWQPRMTTVNNARFDTVVGPDGALLLSIVADPRRSSASWRTRVVLGPGRYRLEGRARTRDAGATIRISGARDPIILSGETDWAQCQYEFSVEEAIVDIEVICELRGNMGAVWFDADSLKIRRLQ